MACLVAGALTAPTAPGVASATEQDGEATETVTGAVTTVIREEPDAAPGTPDDTSTMLITGDGVVELTDDSEVPLDRVVTVELAEASGEEMEVVDVVAVGATTESTSAAVERSGTAPAVRKVYVGIVTPAGYTDGDTNTAESVTALMSKVDDYWSSQTAGQVRFEVAEVRTYTSIHPCGETSSMWDEAADKFSTSPYGLGKHLLLVAPNKSSEWPYYCDYGLGTVGALHAETNLAFVAGDNQSLYAHELGHNLGLHHANALRCQSAQDAVISSVMPSGCRATPYDDLFDVMGFSGEGYGEGSLNVPHIEDLGLEPETIRTAPVGAETTVTLAPLSDASGATRGVKTVDALGNVYFVEYRTDSGRDAAAASNQDRPQLGVRVLRENPLLTATKRTGSYVLNVTPSLDKDDYDHALLPSRTFTNVSGMVEIEVLSQSASGATVKITNGPAAGPDPAPEPKLEPLPPSEPTPVHLKVVGRAALNPRVANTVGVRVLDATGAGAADVNVRVCTTDVRTGATGCFARVTNARGYSSITVTRPRNGVVVEVHETDPATIGTGARRLLPVRPPVNARVARRTVTARVAAAGRSATVLQKQVRRGRWATVARKRTNVNGVVRYVRPGRGRYRVVATPATGRARSVSRVVRV